MVRPLDASVGFVIHTAGLGEKKMEYTNDQIAVLVLLNDQHNNNCADIWKDFDSMDLNYEVFSDVVTLIRSCLFKTFICIVILVDNDRGYNLAQTIEYKTRVSEYIVFNLASNMITHMNISNHGLSTVAAHLESVLQKHVRMFYINFVEESRYVSISNIVFIESKDHMCVFHCYFPEESNYTSALHLYSTLAQIEKQFATESLIRIHQSYLVNPMYIVKLDKQEVILKGHKHLPISRSRKKDAFKKYHEFVLARSCRGSTL